QYGICFCDAKNSTVRRACLSSVSIPSIWDLLLRQDAVHEVFYYKFNVSIPSIWDLLLRQHPKLLILKKRR
ncbi:MAG: hypothetical protein ACTSR9_14880, partial [Candidatus Thorarchaeota archaeon]